MSKKVKLNNLLKSASVLLSAAFAFNAMAQTSYYNNSYNQNNGQYVTVYEHCDYQGNSKQLSVGEYSDVRRAGIANDSISSVRVPQGLTLTMYENERGGGKATIIDRDVKCMNRAWNDQASSLKVDYANGYQSNQDYGQNNGWAQQDFTRDIRRVEFANTAIEKISRDRWQLNNNNGTSHVFREVSRDKQRIYLENTQFPQRLEMDLSARRLTFIAQNGRNIDYPIKNASSHVDEHGFNKTPAFSPGSPSGVIRSGCFNYKAYTLGGNGGVRFHGHDGFYQFGKKAKTGRVCHNGDLVMEINKRNLNTDVIIEINGEEYHFSPSDEPDRLLNSWYRKKVTLKVGR